MGAAAGGAVFSLGGSAGVFIAAAVLMLLLRCVRDLAIAVRPVVPASADRLLDQMGTARDARDHAALADGDWLSRLAASGFRVSQPQGVFPRLELPAEAPA